VPLAAGIEESGFARHPAIYLPILKLCLQFPKTTVAVEPPLSGRDNSRSHSKLAANSCRRYLKALPLYMPTALPGISIGQATQLMQSRTGF